ncbi:pseudouridine synthase TruDPus7 [Pyrenophora tritici-repentis]|nr:pseudouridine synthase TruD Pus7 [Pyrenophora tritici-repentis]PZC93924.1 pseudouridine synthase TruD Pus7 [Pyrenophora tritici-repentis]PZD46665.1 pseudouridine synthase TruDPus7 [Pyrenophora tritici-repentis]
MSRMSEDSSRPAKRAKIDDSSAIDADLEREVRAGITEYVCPDNLGFKGVLKQRYTDFLVNEIGLDGQVLHLTSTAVEEQRKVDQGTDVANGADKEASKSAVIEEQKQDADAYDTGLGGEVKLQVAAKPTPQPQLETAEPIEEPVASQPETQKEDSEKEKLADDDRNTLHSIFGEQTTDEIIKLVRQVRRRESKKAKDFKAVISPPITDKDMRTKAHQSLRRIFPNLLESAMESDQTIRIKATPPAERKNKKGKGGGRDREDHSRRRGGLDWEELGGEYLHFNLYKENKDTMEVVGFLGSKLNCGTKGFGFAGTKDRRACTVQRVCVKRQTAQRMQNFNKMLFNACVGNFEYRHHDLKLGDLMGNEFTITLRDCHFQGEQGLTFEERLKLADNVIGKAITDFSQKGFINYYGLQRFGSFSASTDAVGRKMLQDDLQGAVEHLLEYSDVALAAANGTDVSSDVQVSQDDRNRAKALHIWKTKGSGSEALDFLPRKFTAERNIIQHLSSRNSKSGRYDRKADWQGALMTIPRTLRLMYVHAYQSLVWNTDGEMIINPSGTENANAPEADFERARPLTAAEAASGQYTIWDIVLPQPGFDIEYPQNEIGTFYKKFMGSEKGGGLDPYKMRRQWREVSLSGGYRKFLAKPLGPLTYALHDYTKPDEQFVETDLQRLGKERDLASSQYATMALRELMKAGGVKAYKPDFMGGRTAGEFQ